MNKANQFIFSFKRYTANDLKNDQHILTISLKDRLSDSGIIGVMVASNRENGLKIDELVISCRALGRQIETLMLDAGFRYLAKALKTTDDLLIDFVIGPRNKPAQTWLAAYIQQEITGNRLVRTKLQTIESNPFVQLQFL